MTLDVVTLLGDAVGGAVFLVTVVALRAAVYYPFWQRRRR